METTNLHHHYLKPSEVAKLYRVTLGTVYAWLSAGRFPGTVRIRVGTRGDRTQWRIPRASVLAQMELVEPAPPVRRPGADDGLTKEQLAAKYPTLARAGLL